MKNSFYISNSKTCQELLGEHQFKQNKVKRKGKLLSFDLDGLDETVKNFTAYNPTKPIIKDGKKHLIARVEPKNSESSKAIFFVENQNKWQKLDHPTFNLQDPFYIENIQGWHVLGGVEVFEQKSGFLGYRTLFYRYKNCATELVMDNGNLEKPFAIGPDGMKDIRLISLENGNIGVFTRPQGGNAGLGKVAYIEIKSLDELEELIPKAKIIKDLFRDDEWGGANELHLLENGNIGVLGHIAHFEGEIRHYYALSFIFDIRNHTVSNVEILATADEFPKIKSKKPDLGKIVFSGGLFRNGDGTADLYVGIGDTKAGNIRIKDPFAKYELSYHNG